MRLGRYAAVPALVLLVACGPVASPDAATMDVRGNTSDAVSFDAPPADSALRDDAIIVEPDAITSDAVSFDAPAADVPAAVDSGVRDTGVAPVCSTAGEMGRVAGITQAHNTRRASVDTSVSMNRAPIPCLSWNAARAAAAQPFADMLARSCTAMHSTGAINGEYGENVALVTRDYSAAQVVGAWFAEQACFTYGPISTTTGCDTACTRRLPVPSASCGHYTAIVWRDTTSVGCAVANCGDGRRSIWVCQYMPAGNYVGRRPY
ncbi:MAG: hypothetical protein JNK05_22235 [Myxococcales bacterium]|nr:hypothetical protein [Myxococcales bacterium]